MTTILHITTHLGGGVGNAIAGIAERWKITQAPYALRIGILEEPEKSKYKIQCENWGAEVFLIDSRKRLIEELERADVVCINWWNHPGMAAMLANFPRVPVRLIMWAHVSGCSYPIIPYVLTTVFDRVLFTSPYSYENPLWNASEKADVLGKSAIVYGAGTLKSSSKPSTKSGSEFRIGYMGTLKFSKLYPRFAELCNKIEIPEARFYLIGDNDNIQLHERIAACGQTKRFNFLGFVDDVDQVLAAMDIFLYPLNPEHFGTTENAMLEAMNAGLPVVAFNQAAEKFIIQDRETGLLANDEEQFVQCVHMLYFNKEERLRIGERAQAYVKETYCAEKMVSAMNGQLEAVLAHDKETVDFASVIGENPYQWFLNGLGNDRATFEESMNTEYADLSEELAQKWGTIARTAYILQEPTKSSLYHFNRCYPNDIIIKKWIDLMETADK